jgi:hypothetical protein
MRDSRPVAKDVQDWRWNALSHPETSLLKGISAASRAEVASMRKILTVVIAVSFGLAMAMRALSTCVTNDLLMKMCPELNFLVAPTTFWQLLP